MLVAGPREPSVSLQGHFHRLMWPELVIATSIQHWARARSVVGLSWRIGQQCHKLHRANVSRVGIHGWAGISRRQGIEKNERSVCSCIRICAFPNLLQRLLLRRLLMERRAMFARSGTAESDLLRKWSALGASAVNFRIVP